MLKRLSVLWSVIRGDARMLWFALKHPLSPSWVKLAAAAIALYVVWPIDLIPDVIPVLGWMDDAVLVPLAIRWVINRLPDAVRGDFARRESS